MDDHLEHVGVLGMRWGRRKTEDSLDTRKDGFVIKKGSVINRTTANPNELHSGKMYASFKKFDSLGYMARSLPFTTTFNMRMTVTKDLISPSKRARVDAFIDLCRTDGTFLRNVADGFYNTTKIYSPEVFEQRYKKMSEAQLRARAYENMSVTLNFDKTVRDKYFGELKKRGYNMVLDDADAQVVSNSPIIVFDRGDTLKVASIDRVTWGYLKQHLSKGMDVTLEKR